MNKFSFFMLALLVLAATSCVEDLGKTTVTYEKAEAVYGNLDDLRSAELISPSKSLIDPGKVYVSDDLLLIGEEGQGIHVYDNSTPESPIGMYFINIPSNHEFYVADNKIYAESLFDVIKIDISDKHAPTIEQRIENAFGEPLTNNEGEELIGFEYSVVTETLDKSSSIFGLDFQNNTIFFDFQQQLIPTSNVPASFAGSSGSSIGTVNRIARTNDHVYIISNSLIYTFSDDSSFEKVSEIPIGWEMETIYPQGQELFIGTRNSMEILSIAFDAGNPEWISSFAHATSCDPVLPNGNTAYVTLRSGTACDGFVDGLSVIDVSNVRLPVSIQEIEMESPYGMTIVEGQLYVGEGENGLKIFDIEENGALSLVEHDKNIQAYDVIPHPTRADIILVASPDGFGQYQISTNSRKLLSWIAA